MDIVSKQRINILIYLAELQSISNLSSSPAYRFIKQIAEECSCTNSELTGLITSPEEIASLGALSESQKKAYMYSICELMTFINLDQQKKLFCQSLAYDLNYDSNQMNVIFESFQKQAQLQAG